MFDLAEEAGYAEVVVAGKRLEVLTLEPAPGAETTIVMLHEGLGSVALWKSFPAQLAARTGARVIAYSRYGYGRSEILAEKREVDYMHREGEVVLGALLRKLNVERPVLFGHSDGASIALVYAATEPQGVAALILEAPHVFVEELSVASIADAKELYRSSDMPAKLARYHRDAGATFWGWNDIWLDPRFRAWNIEPLLPRVTCPVLVLQGHDDEYGTQAQVAAIAAAIPDTTVLMLEECGHSPHRDQTQTTLAASVTFLERVRCDFAAKGK